MAAPPWLFQPVPPRTLPSHQSCHSKIAPKLQSLGGTASRSWVAQRQEIYRLRIERPFTSHSRSLHVVSPSARRFVTRLSTVPADRLNSLADFITTSQQVSELIPIRSKIGAEWSETDPRFFLLITRPVQSGNSKYCVSDVSSRISCGRT